MTKISNVTLTGHCSRNHTYHHAEKLYALLFQKVWWKDAPYCYRHRATEGFRLWLSRSNENKDSIWFCILHVEMLSYRISEHFHFPLYSGLYLIQKKLGRNLVICGFKTQCLWINPPFKGLLSHTTLSLSDPQNILLNSRAESTLKFPNTLSASQPREVCWRREDFKRRGVIIPVSPLFISSTEVWNPVSSSSHSPNSWHHISYTTISFLLVSYEQSKYLASSLVYGGDHEHINEKFVM